MGIIGKDTWRYHFPIFHGIHGSDFSRVLHSLIEMSDLQPDGISKKHTQIREGERHTRMEQYYGMYRLIPRLLCSRVIIMHYFTLLVYLTTSLPLPSPSPRSNINFTQVPHPPPTTSTIKRVAYTNQKAQVPTKSASQNAHIQKTTE